MVAEGVDTEPGAGAKGLLLPFFTLFDTTTFRRASDEMDRRCDLADKRFNLQNYQKTILS